MDLKAIGGGGVDGAKLDPTELWRMIIMFGLNTATYKIALGQALSDFVSEQKTNVTMHDLAEKFFDLYRDRLESGGKPQLAQPDRQTVMERIYLQNKSGQLSRHQAVDMVEREAFSDVIPRFHVLGNGRSPLTFYEPTAKGLVLTDQLFEVFTKGESEELLRELDSRWALLEAAFQMRREDSELQASIRQIYLAKGYERVNVTNTIDVLNAYQNGRCFYCGEQMANEDVHVDHLIPRQFVYHDEIWNLVLAHSVCNLHKSDHLVSHKYIQRLIERNEYFIVSNHPIKGTLVRQLGSTAKARADYINRVYGDARVVIRTTWEGIGGYDPETDKFYKAFVRTFASRGSIG